MNSNVIWALFGCLVGSTLITYVPARYQKLVSVLSGLAIGMIIVMIVVFDYHSYNETTRNTIRGIR
jgi:hypothetical protein